MQITKKQAFIIARAITKGFNEGNEVYFQICPGGEIIATKKHKRIILGFKLGAQRQRKAFDSPLPYPIDLGDFTYAIQDAVNNSYLMENEELDTTRPVFSDSAFSEDEAAYNDIIGGPRATENNIANEDDQEAELEEDDEDSIELEELDEEDLQKDDLEEEDLTEDDATDSENSADTEDEEMKEAEAAEETPESTLDAEDENTPEVEKTSDNTEEAQGDEAHEEATEEASSEDVSWYRNINEIPDGDDEEINFCRFICTSEDKDTLILRSKFLALAIILSSESSIKEDKEFEVWKKSIINLLAALIIRICASDNTPDKMNVRELLSYIGHNSTDSIARDFESLPASSPAFIPFSAFKHNKDENNKITLRLLAELLDGYTEEGFREKIAKFMEDYIKYETKQKLKEAEETKASSESVANENRPQEASPEESQGGTTEDLSVEETPPTEDREENPSTNHFSDEEESIMELNSVTNEQNKKAKSNSVSLENDQGTLDAYQALREPISSNDQERTMLEQLIARNPETFANELSSAFQRIISDKQGKIATDLFIVSMIACLKEYGNNVSEMAKELAIDERDIIMADYDYRLRKEINEHGHAPAFR